MTYYVTMLLEVTNDKIPDEEDDAGAAVENCLREAAADSGWQVRWTVVQAAPSQELCNEHAADKLTSLGEGKQVKSNVVTNTYPGSELIRDGQRMPTSITENTRVVCLPDTIDPRGPKGSGR
jgi:hypothetical protein